MWPLICRAACAYAEDPGLRLGRGLCSSLARHVFLHLQNIFLSVESICVSSVFHSSVAKRVALQDHSFAPCYRIRMDFVAIPHAPMLPQRTPLWTPAKRCVPIAWPGETVPCRRACSAITVSSFLSESAGMAPRPTRGDLPLDLSQASARGMDSRMGIPATIGTGGP